MKPHGLRGETVVDLVTNRAERSTVGAVFSSDRGQLRVTQVRPFQGRWLMTFEGVGSKEAADALRGTVLLAPALDDADALWVHELVGSLAVSADEGQELGRVVAVVANPASDLLELEDGTLVPARFVVAHSPGRVMVDVPEGIAE